MHIASWFDSVLELDTAGFYLINRTLRNSFFDLLMPFMTDKWNAALPIALLFLYVMIFRPKRDRVLAISSIAVLVIADASAQLLKDLIHRIRPCEVLKGAVCSGPLSPMNYAGKLANETFLVLKGVWKSSLGGHALNVGVRSSSSSFPSNHASNVFALAAFFSYNYRKLMIPCFITAALIGYSRIYLGAHYPTDVLAGIALGMLVGFSAALVVRQLTRVGQTEDPIGPGAKEDCPVARPKSSQ